MSDQNTSEREPSVASNVKEKDPKRVATGKRLGAISKQAKEAKREAQREALRLERQVETEAENNKYTLYFIGGLVVVGTVSYYLYLNKDKNKDKIVSQKKLPTIPEEPTEGKASPPKINSKRIFGD